MIWDCFLFMNEFELLDMRLHELADTVDTFVLCEATHTFTGRPKPLHFDQNKDAFRKWLPRMIHVVAAQPPVEDAWQNEHNQRDALGAKLEECCAEDDVILLSDVDEIPRPEMIPRTPPRKPTIFQQRLFYYYVNCLQEQMWFGTIAGKLRDMIPLSRTRERRRRWVGPRVSEAGWHFSFIGGVDRIAEKLQSYAETSTDKDEWKDPDHIFECMRTGKDLFERDGAIFEKHFVKINEKFPACIHKMIKKYPYLVP